MTLTQAFGLLIILAAAAGGVWLYFKLLKFSDDPARILFKTGITIVVIIVAGFVIGPIMQAGGSVAALVIPAGAVTGIILTLIWREHIANLAARPFENLFTGGATPPKPEAFYSIARTHRQKQQFDEALWEIEQQLERFPNDFTGLMMMAEIQAQDQLNLSGAAATIERICTAQRQQPRNFSLALNALADWHLRIGRNREAARACFERIQNTFARHPVAVEAAQRLAHLPSDEMLASERTPRTIELRELPRVSVREAAARHVAAASETRDEAVSRLTGQLELHPLDHSAREELVSLHAGEPEDIRLAIDHLEFLINQPGFDKHKVVKWLNQIADHQVQISHDAAAAGATLDRIIKKYPGSPAAEQAGRRKMLLGRELKGNEKSRDVPLGSYEKDLGLR